MENETGKEYNTRLNKRTTAFSYHQHSFCHLEVVFISVLAVGCPGGPVAQALGSQCRGRGLIPGRELSPACQLKIAHAAVGTPTAARYINKVFKGKLINVYLPSSHLFSPLCFLDLPLEHVQPSWLQSPPC